MNTYMHVHEVFVCAQWSQRFGDINGFDAFAQLGEFDVQRDGKK